MNLIERVLAGFGPEDREHYAVVQWCEAQGIAIFHVPNNTWTKSIMQRTRNNLLGVRAGVPDIFIPIPEIGLLVIEMKRPKQGKQSNYATPAQKQWLDTLQKVPGVETRVCFGAEEAVNFIKQYLPAKRPASKNQPVF